ncbi:MAG: ABC transporter permease, partial [Candidatus Competibacteraceae bacterium]|nr:ABC transporter permease [Candidatus Competibacteraceae bacterium]
MRFKHLSLAALGVVLTASGFYASSAIAQDEQFIPLLVYRSGPYAPNGIPLADGQSDYYKL